MAARTLFDKIWDDHVVETLPDGTSILYIDRHLVHEVTSPQAFEGLRLAGRKLRHPERTVAVVDHNVPHPTGASRSRKRTAATRLKRSNVTSRNLAFPIFRFCLPIRGLCMWLGRSRGFPCRA